MANPNPWTWDVQRRAYYMYNRDTGLYIYEDGTRIDSSGRVVVVAAAPTVPKAGGPASREVASRIETAGDDLANRFGSISVNDNQSYSSNYHASSSSTMDHQYRGSTGSKTSSSANAVSSGFATQLPNLLLQSGPSVPLTETTDPALAALNLASRGRLRGNWPEHENLFPAYKIRKPGRKFFVRGKVIKVLWPELAGASTESITVTKEAKFGEGIATKIRWFIIVREGARFCTCIPIATYNGQGVSKRGIIKSHHAIAFTSKHEPEKQDFEKSKRGDEPMLPGIRIKASHTGDKLDPMARIDFSRTYTVEHNVKVYDFGVVAKDYRSRLIQQWIKVLLKDDQGALTAFGASTPSFASEPGDDDDADDGPGQDDDDEDDDEDNVSVIPKKSGQVPTSSSSSRPLQPESRSQGKKSVYPSSGPGLRKPGY